jgi:hypothetical protein
VQHQAPAVQAHASLREFHQFFQFDIGGAHFAQPFMLK